ncbi:T9SS type A sorting domain-containing protein [Chryseobacterium sp. NEB161]|nr:T9SS type A sorting domain-containing protein [Chryseobacterium sp. NEB161]
MKNYTLLCSLFFYVSLSAQTIVLENFASGLSSPVEIIASPTSDNRLFVVQQSGTIKIVNENGSLGTGNFLDITDRITYNGERGLLGLAFHPQFSVNRYFYVYYNTIDGSVRLSRFTANAGETSTADASSEKIMLTIPKSFANHNGGSIHFAPDGKLWISTGDGGGTGDPDNNAQNKNSLLGKILRIDVNSESAYAIPTDNPFVGKDGADEVWAFGLRNAWKFSFDRTAGTAMIADVGQGAIEEINKVSANSAGVNYGWKCYEGNNTYNTTDCADSSTMTFPIAQYGHEGGKCSITGGYVYRGNQYQDLMAKYLFADYCSGQIGVLDNANTIVWTTAFSGNNFTTFGEDNNKQLYIAASNGNIYKIKTENLAVSDISNNGILLAPNPTTEYVYIYNLNADNVSADIMDSTGRLIRTTKISGSNNRIDISELQPGSYFINLIKDSQKFLSQKLIKE